MYSLKIQEDIVPYLYHKAKSQILVSYWVQEGSLHYHPKF
jgi:hypothetical protein